MGWLTGMGPLGVPRWIFAGVAVLGAVAALIWAVTAYKSGERAHDTATREIGATVQRETNLQETVKEVEKANEVRANTNPGDRTFYDQCLRSSRPSARANCERFLPGGQASAGGAGSPAGGR